MPTFNDSILSLNYKLHKTINNTNMKLFFKTFKWFFNLTLTIKDIIMLNINTNNRIYILLIKNKKKL